MTPLKMKLSLLLTFISLSAWPLEPYQGSDYPLQAWMCGAPLVEALRKHDPESLLQDGSRKLNMKESLEAISESNLNRLRKKLGTLSSDEQSLLHLISSKYPAPIIHRASVDTSKFIVTSKVGLESATKRKAPSAVTPLIEHRLFSGGDCIFTSVASPYGIYNYGTVIFKFSDKKGFAWGSLYTGYRWALEIEKKDLSQDPGDGMKRRFAEQIFTNNHWDEVMGLLIIENVRKGSSFRGKGASYDKDTMLAKLLSESSRTKFWGTVVHHRLAFLEGHFIDNIPLKHVDYVQYRLSDKPTVESWGLPSSWFGDDDSFIQYFNRAM